MKPIGRILLTIGLSTVCVIAFAQKPKQTPVKNAPVQKFTPPKLYSSLGIRSDSVTVVVDEALQLVALPLRITDDKKTSYTISSYQLMYKRSSIIVKDESASEGTHTTRNIAQLFRETPLPEIWKKSLMEQINKGDELYFFDIIVKDAQGRLMFAPELKIKIN